jgi:hypothetical protein
MENKCLKPPTSGKCTDSRTHFLTFETVFGYVKSGYPKNSMLNTNNGLKSVIPQVFNVDLHLTIGVPIQFQYGVQKCGFICKSRFVFPSNSNELLVGGIPTPLKNMKVSWDYEIPNIWKVIKNHIPNHQSDYHFPRHVATWRAHPYSHNHFLGYIMLWSW